MRSARARSRRRRALVDVPAAELVTEAGRLRDHGHGNRVTFSPKVFIPLTMLCRDRCGYCTFAKPPARLDAPYLSLDDVLDIARRGAGRRLPRGAVHAGRSARGALSRSRATGSRITGTARPSTTSWTRARTVLDETGLLPHANAGALSQAELERLRAVSPSQGMMIETLADTPGRAGRPAPRRARQDAGTPARDARSGGSRTRAVHHRDPRRHRRDARRAHRRACSRSRRATPATGTCRR